MKTPALQNNLVWGLSFTNGFLGPKCFQDFRETSPKTRFRVLSDLFEDILNLAAMLVPWNSNELLQNS